MNETRRCGSKPQTWGDVEVREEELSGSIEMIWWKEGGITDRWRGTGQTNENRWRWNTHDRGKSFLMAEIL